MNTRKLKKFVTSPGTFFRDYLIKKYPVINSEQNITEEDEQSVIYTEELNWQQENCLTYIDDIPVDIVYTWVDNQDIEWVAKKNKYLPNIETLVSSIDNARFENHNELYYSILSVRKYLPWIRNIFIITDKQTPNWLKKSDNIKIIDHKEIIDSQYLPTFNSHVIEANLHKISDLSEYFIYFNDDVLVARPLSKYHFFRKNGLQSIFVTEKSLEKMQLKGIKTPTLLASKNSNLVLKKNYGVTIDSPLVHTYVPLRKSIFKECYEKNIDQINSFQKNKYRAKDDLNMATFLVPWWTYLCGKAVITPELCYYFNIRSPHAESQYRRLLQSKMNKTSPHSMCLNDFKAENTDENYAVKLQLFLKTYYC